MSQWTRRTMVERVSSVSVSANDIGLLLSSLAHSKSIDSGFNRYLYAFIPLSVKHFPHFDIFDAFYLSFKFCMIDKLFTAINATFPIQSSVNYMQFSCYRN